MKLRALSMAGAVCALALLLSTWAAAAPITDAPTRVTQPDGAVLDLYSSGDEFFNYLHDQAGNLVMRRADGWYVYAENEDGAPAPTGAVVTSGDPDQAALFGVDGMTAADIDFAAHAELRAQLPMGEAQGEEVRLGEVRTDPEETPARLFSDDGTPTKMANLVVFIRFKGEEEFITLDENGAPIAPIPDDAQIEGLPTTIHFGQSYSQVSQYMRRVSNQHFDVVTTFLSADPTRGTIASVEAPRPRSYYESISGSGMDRFYAEMELLEYALAKSAESLPRDIELDYNNDGKVDNITFIVSGSTAGWNDLLWPHSWALQDHKVTIPNWDGQWKQCYQFNFNFANPRYAGVGVLSHELLHAVGYPDLYRYDYSGDPVGRWDAMGSTDYADPQFLGAYLKSAYTDWGRLGRINTSGTYTLWPLGTEPTADDPAWEGFQIPTGTMGEYICVEYRKNGAPGSVTEDNVPCDGLLVYRANRKAVEGNRNGSVNGGDEVYIFRPGDDRTNAGAKEGLSVAALDGAERAAMGYGLDAEVDPVQTLYLDNGQNSGIVIDQVALLDDGRISFRVTMNDDPEPIVPGRYDVDGGDYFIDQSGAYVFYGSTSRHHITVAAEVTGVSITFEGADMDLASLNRELAPLILRSDSEATVTFAPAADGSEVTLLAGSQYMPGILVEKGAAALLQGGGGRLNAAGGIGAPGVGGDAFQDGGSLHLKDLAATLTGGGRHTISTGGVIVQVSYGSAALGSGFRQRMDGILIENCQLEIMGASGAQALATSYLDLDAGAYVSGGDITIRGSSVACQGSVDAGERLTVEDSDLSVKVSNASGYNGALNAVQSIRLLQSHTALQALGSNTGMNRNTRDTCQVEVRGGSLRSVAPLSGIAGSPIAIGSDVALCVASGGDEPLSGPWTPEGASTSASITAPAGDELGVFCQGTFQTAITRRTVFTLADPDTGARTYLDLPNGTKSFVCRLPQTGSYTLSDEEDNAGGPLEAGRQGMNYANGIVLEPLGRLVRHIGISDAPAAITQSGAYALSGAGSGALTVADGLEVTLYLDGLTLRSADGPALTVGADTHARIVVKTGSENLLAGAAGSPAILGQTGSVLAFEGSGMAAVLGSGSAPGVRGLGRVTAEPVTTLIALSGGPQALTRGQDDGALWGSGPGPQPGAVRLALAQPLAGDDVLRVFTPKGAYPVPAASGTASVFLTLAAPGQTHLERGDGSSTDPFPCQAGVNDFANVAFHPVPTYDGGVLDLSLGNHLITRNGTYTVTGSTSEHNLRVAPGVSATLRLDNVRVAYFHREDDPAGIIDLGGGSLVTLELLPGTDNRLEVKAEGNQTCGVHVPATARLAVLGSGSLRISGGAYASAIGALGSEQGGSIAIQDGQIQFVPPSGSSSITTALGGSGSQVDIEGGSITQSATYGGGIGGQGARVAIRGGEIAWASTDHSPIGGSDSSVTISGGRLALDLSRGRMAVGGRGSRIQLLGGEVELRSPADCSTLSAALGGDQSQLTLSGGSVTGTLGRITYSSNGALGGVEARASVSGEFQMLLRYLHVQTRPIVNEELLDFQTGGAFLDLRLRSAMAADETLRLVRQSDGREVAVALKTRDWGFFLRLEPGVWELYNAQGEFGGSYALTAGVTPAQDVAFDRLPGVFLEGRTVEYSAAAHYLQVSALPAGASARYSGNGQMEPGSYTVTATITTPQGTTYDLTAPLVIQKAPLRVTGIRADGKVYDGNTRATGRVLCQGLKGSDAPGFAVTFAFQNPSAGTGKTVTATVPQLSGVWAGRYELAPVEPTLLTTTADITPKEVKLSFRGGDLLQMAGAVQPVVPQFSQYGLSAGGIGVTYAASGGGASATPPQTPGTYTVTATVTDPNFQGSATDTLEVREGFDLRLADAVIDAPGSYLITSFGEETAHTIRITEQAATSSSPSVRIYLNNVNIRAPEGKSALDSQMHNMFRTCYTHLYVQGDAPSRLQGGEGAPAIQTKDYLELHGEGRLDVVAGLGASTGVEVVQVLYGSGGVVSGYSPSKMQLGSFTGSLWVMTSLKTEEPAYGSGWLAMDFAQAPQADTVFTLQEGTLEQSFTLPAGYAYVWHKAPAKTDLRLLDHRGGRLRADSFEYGDLSWTDIPLEAEAPVVDGDLNAANGPFVISKSGSYRLYGDYLAHSLSQPFLTVEGGLEVELTLDDASVMIYNTTQPLISLGRHVDLILNARGENELQSLSSSAIWTQTTSGNPTYSHLTLRGEPGSTVELWGSAVKDGRYTGADATVHAGTVQLESGSWHLQQLRANCQADAWLLRAVNGFAMTGGELTMDTDGTGSYCVGGLFSKGDVSLTGGTLRLVPYAKAHDYPGIRVEGDRTLVIDGAEVTIDHRGQADSDSVYIPDGTVELRSGSLTLTMGALDGRGIYCKDLVAVGGFSLVGIDTTPVNEDGTDVKTDNPNHLLVHTSGGTDACLPGPDGKTPVLLLGQFDKPMASSEYQDIPLTYTDAQGNAVTVVFPPTKSDRNKYLNYLLLLPQAGEYTASYTRNGSTQVSTVTVAADGTVSGGGFTAANRFTGVAMPAKKTVVWDGQSHTMEVEYEGTLPPDARIEYLYETADGLPPVEPRGTPYGITARLTAPGYEPFETRGLLTIQKRPLTVQAQAVDKSVYDGSTETQGQVTLAGAIPGDQFTAAAVFHFADANVGRNKPVTVSQIQVTAGPEGWAEHYSLPDTVQTTASILEKATLTVHFNELTLTQSYGSTEPVLVTLTTAEGETVALSPTLLYDGAEAVPTLPGLYAVTAQLEHINYQASGAASLRVQPRALTFTALPVPDAAADGPADQTVEADEGFALAEPGLVAGDRVGVRFQVHYTDLTPGEGRAATISQLILTGEHAGRYRVADYPVSVLVTVQPGGSSDALYQGTLDGAERSLPWVYTKAGRLSVSGLAAGERVLAARYDSRGRLLDVRFLTTQTSSVSLGDDASQVKLFWLDRDCRPLSPHAVVWE